MKNLLLLLVTSLVFLAGCKTKKIKVPGTDIPAAVAVGFQHKYPNAQVSEWEVENESGNLVYEVGFTMGTDKKEASFTPDGTFIKEE